MHNYVDFFRFNNGYNDVFVQPNGEGYVYAEAEPYNQPYIMSVRDYYLMNGTIHPGLSGGETIEYLESLEPAPYDIAQAILTEEYIDTYNNNFLEDGEEPITADDVHIYGYEIYV